MTTQFSGQDVDRRVSEARGDRITNDGRPSLPGFWINCLLASIMLTGEFLRGHLGSSFPRAALYVGLILLVGAAWLQGLRCVLSRVPRLSAIGLIASVVVSGFFLALALDSDALRLALGLPPSTWSMWVALLICCVIFPWWVVSLEMLLSTRRRIRAYRQALIVEAASHTSISEEQAELIDVVRAQVQREVHVMLSPVIRHLDDQLRREHDLTLSSARESLAAALNETAREQIRPISHRLHTDSQRDVTAVRPRNLLSTVVRTSRFYPLAVSMIFLITDALVYFEAFSPTYAAILLATGVTIIFAVMTTANMVMRKYPSHHAAIFICTLVVMQLPLLVNYWYFPEWSISTSTAGSLVVEAFFGTAFIIVISGLGSWRGTALARIELEQTRLEREWQEQLHRRQVTSDVLKEAAQVLHGSLQTKLTAAALALTLGGQHANEETMLRSLEQARQALDDPFPTAVTTQPCDYTLHEALEGVTRPWSGLCRIEIDTSGCPPDHPLTHSCALLVQEAVTNAIRHGQARHITIRLVAIDHALAVSVQDDGQIVTPPTKGLGTHFIDDIASEWTRQESSQGGSVLTAVIALPDSSPAFARDNDA